MRETFTNRVIVFLGTVLGHSEHDCNSQHFEVVVSNAVSKCIGFCVTPPIRTTSNMFFEKCTHATIQNPRVWNKLYDFNI